MARHPELTQPPKGGIKLRPLKHRALDGSLYQRDQKVEEQIISVILLDASSVIKRAKIRSKGSPDFLKEEVIVYLIREYLIRQDKATVGALCEILFRRCSSYIKYKFLSLDDALSEQAFSEVIRDVMDPILDIKDNNGDYFQVRFWSGLRRKTIDAGRKYYTEQKKRAKKTINDEEDMAIHDKIGEEIQDTALSAEDIIFCRQALNILPEPIRTAFVLRYYHGWQIESDDPEMESISDYFGKTSRTIRHWLTQAHKILRKWHRGEGKEPYS
ncbi:MAG: hypothetical protein ABR911_07720 [Syntrophales bacterium]